MIKLYLINNYRSYYPELSSSALTDEILGEIFKSEGVHQSTILRTENGKPYEKDGKIRFSLSHSGDIFACAISGDGSFNIGLDIQSRLPGDSEKIAERFFTHEEKEFLRRIHEQEAVDCSGDISDPGRAGIIAAFLRIWTRKEALIKYMGATMGQVMGRESVLDRDDVKFIDMIIEGGLNCCLCIPRGQDPSVEIVKWTPETEH